MISKDLRAPEDWLSDPCCICGNPGMMQHPPNASFTSFFCDACHGHEERRSDHFRFGCFALVAALLAGALFLIGTHG